MNREPLYKGGCQCGAVRYALHAELTDASICHCRMCQKAFGSYFAPLAGVPFDKLEWISGAPAIYRSSTVAERGFCAVCGTPLTFRYVDRDKISVSLGSLDEPARVKPDKQDGIEGRMPWFDELHLLPGEITEDGLPQDMQAKLKSHQHPDG